MEEYILHPEIKNESDSLNTDREYEAVKWMSISKASTTIADILHTYIGELMPWQVEGLQFAQECLKEYTHFIDLLTSDKLLLKKEA